MALKRNKYKYGCKTCFYGVLNGLNYGTEFWIPYVFISSLPSRLTGTQTALYQLSFDFKYPVSVITTRSLLPTVKVIYIIFGIISITVKCFPTLEFVLLLKKNYNKW